ncbi:DUF4124 domain-containing protein [Aquabacterium soli]|nr:DUF4124 domain-containing protein [Aquabacterium soli]
MNRIASLAMTAAPLLLAALVALPTQAAMQWKWRDAQGQVQYSDRPPPPGVLDKDILKRPSGSARATQALPSAPEAAPSAAPLPGLKASDPALEARKRKADAEKEATQKAEEAKQAKTRSENCERARSYQRTLDSGMRVARTSASGEREVLDDKGRAEEDARNRDVIKSNCK